MSCQVTKLNHAKNHQDFADKDMPAHIITIPEIADAVQENSDIGKSASVFKCRMLNSSKIQYDNLSINSCKKASTRNGNLTISCAYFI